MAGVLSRARVGNVDASLEGRGGVGLRLDVLLVLGRVVSVGGLCQFPVDEFFG